MLENIFNSNYLFQKQIEIQESFLKPRQVCTDGSS